MLKSTSQHSHCILPQSLPVGQRGAGVRLAGGGGGGEGREVPLIADPGIAAHSPTHTPQDQGQQQEEQQEFFCRLAVYTCPPQEDGYRQGVQGVLWWCPSPVTTSCNHPVTRAVPSVVTMTSRRRTRVPDGR